MESLLALSAIACLIVLFIYAPRAAIFVVCAPFVGFVLVTIWAALKN